MPNAKLRLDQARFRTPQGMVLTEPRSDRTAGSTPIGSRRRGRVEYQRRALHLTEVPARRWHRWGDRLGPVDVQAVFAHTGLRAPFAFPDGTSTDWVVTPDGWRTRAPAPAPG